VRITARPPGPRMARRRRVLCAAPLIPAGFVHRRAALVPNVLQLLLGISGLSTLFMLTLYTQQVLGYTQRRRDRWRAWSPGRGRRQLTSPPRAGPQRRARPLFGASLALRPAAPVCPGLASGAAVPLTAPCSGTASNAARTRCTGPRRGRSPLCGAHARRAASRSRPPGVNSRSVVILARRAASLLIALPALPAGARGPARAKVVTRAHAPRRPGRGSGALPGSADLRPHAGLGKRDSRPLREAVGELVAAIPFSLKPVHGRTCCGPRKRTNRRPLTSSRPSPELPARRRAPGHRARPRCPARARHQSGPRLSGDHGDSHHRTTRPQLIEQCRRASCGPAPASSGGCGGGGALAGAHLGGPGAPAQAAITRRARADGNAP
jgi:hypothetical protein